MGMVDLSKLTRECDGPPAETVSVSRRWLRALRDELIEAREIKARLAIGDGLARVQDELLGGGS